jgi:hypothetical protein
MKAARFFAMAFLATASLSLMAQETGADGSEKAVYAPQGPMGFGDEASSHAYEMTSVTGELEGKLEAKNAKVGDRVILKTTEKVQTSDGTVIHPGPDARFSPRGFANGDCIRSCGTEKRARPRDSYVDPRRKLQLECDGDE